MKFVFVIFFFALGFFVNAQESLQGSWNTGQDNTIVEFSQEDEKWIGRIQSSDRKDVEIGKTILKDLEKQGDSWKGKIYVVKRQKWTNVKITPRDTQLDLVVSAGFAKKAIQWLKADE